MTDRTASSRPILRRPQRGAIFAGPLGRLVARPWLDPLALWLLRRHVFPQSRLWAAAIEAGGDLDRFVASIGRAPHRMPSRTLLLPALMRIATLDRDWRAADRIWLDSFFGAADPVATALIDAERRWRRTSHARYGARRHVAPFVRRIRPPCVRFDIPSSDEVAARFDPADPPRLPAPAETWLPEESRRIRTSRGIEFWLRAPSPIAGDTMWAHVYEPPGAENPPTAILCHGLGIETEMLNGVVDSTLYLLSRGLRVVHPSAPGHNRRCKPGWYGGEELLATQPLGAMETLQAATAELGMLMRWARRASPGAKVGLGGTSLGALTSQYAACRMRDWPAECRPDALLLATTSGLAATLSTASSLAHAVGLPEALSAAGWSPEALVRLGPLVDPAGPCPLDPGAVTMLVGTSDTVTPPEDAMVLARRWQVPAENIHLRNRGHFSAAIGMLFDRGPLDRFADRLAAG